MVLVLLCLALPLGAAAQEALPGLFRVTGVATDDVLNVRAGPGAAHPVVATLAPDAAPVEVVARHPETGWLLVNAEDRAGYASPLYLERIDAPAPRDLPLPLSCSGTEPFWGLEFEEGGRATFSDPELYEDRPLTLDWSGAASSRLGRELGAVLSGGGLRLQAVLQRQECSDGMSDRAYGFKADVLVQDGGRTFMLTGCCALLR
jgi:uncharacterized membrane protein